VKFIRQILSRNMMICILL